MKNESLKEKENEENNSENNISDITDQAIFQGAFGLLNKGVTKPTKQSKQPQQGNNDIKEDPSKSKILQNLTKMDQPTTGTSNSMYSSGILSFRNKKAYFHNPQFSTSLNPNQKCEENLDKDAITQSILQKMNTVKKTKKNSSSAYGNNKKEKERDRDRGKLLNNESTKAYEEEYDEKDFKAFNTNSSDEQCKSDKENDDDDDNENDNEGEESNRIFWQVKKNKDSELSEKHKDSTFNTQMTSGRKKRHKYLNKIICTLSLLEKGRAIFVSQDDMIFVLPALFVPKNLNVGNTYVFKVREYEPFSFKSNLIQDIQKKYAS